MTIDQAAGALGLLIGLAALLGPAPAKAQPAIENLPGLWRADNVGVCPARSVSASIALPNVAAGIRPSRCLQGIGYDAPVNTAAGAQGDGCFGGAGCNGDSPAPDAFLNPATFTNTEVLLVQDALIWTDNYTSLKDGVWGKGSVEGIRNWRLANALPPAVSLRPAEMSTLLRQAAAKAGFRWTVLVDPASGATIGVPLSLVSAHAWADETEYTGDKGVSLKVRSTSASIDTIRAMLGERASGADLQHLAYRLDKPDRQVLSYDSVDGSSVYVRLDRVADGWRGFSARVSHGFPAYTSLITAFSADFDAAGVPAAVPNAWNAPQLFGLMSPPALGSPPLCPMAVAAPARVANAGDALWRNSQPTLRPRLNAALETSPSDLPIDWSDDATGLSAELVVHPANPVRPVPCRAFSYTVRQAGTAVLVTGTRCRHAAGLWEGTGSEDRLVPLGVTLPVERGVAQPPVSTPDILVRALQLNLRRLAYFDGPPDGIASASLRAAVMRFEQDENVPADGEPNSAVEDLSEAAIARIPAPGACPGVTPPGDTVVCGQVR